MRSLIVILAILVIGLVTVHGVSSPRHTMKPYDMGVDINQAYRSGGIR